MTKVRRPLIAANWKMHHLRQDASRYCRELRGLLSEEASVDVAIFPSFTLLSVVAEGLAGSSIAWGGQDLHTEPKGAFTGDISGEQLADLGCSWVLCGHSERRLDPRETDERVGKKAAAARNVGLKPMICIGETAAERRRGATEEVLDRQFRAAVAERPAPFALAYEPVWAIGTGETATPEMAQETHAFLRSLASRVLGDDSAEGLRILYGGSVKPANAASLFAQKDIDGFLVGGASLDPGSFSGIIGSSGPGL